VMSSANYNTVILKFATRSLALCIIACKVSVARIKSRGENGSPYLRPHWW
jgi:hypothetical protein